MKRLLKSLQGELRNEIGYVPQERLLRRDDSVDETLKNAAELKLPKGVSEEEINVKVDNVLKVLGLERENESLVCKLSGRQRKRLSIALEYIADPSLFFLDEPDSELAMIMDIEGMEEVVAVLPQNLVVKANKSLESFLHDYTYRKIYRYEAELVTDRWMYLLGFSAIYIIVALLSLEWIDFDKR